MSTSKDGFGAISVKWIPYKAMIPVIATFLYFVEKTLKSSEKSFAMRILRKWYWASVFSERYSGSPENTSVNDLKELVNSTLFMNEPKIIDRARAYVEKLDLRKVSSSSSAIYKGIINLIVLNGAKDFFYGENIAFHKLEDHHIFPQNYLRKVLNLDDKDKINTILNRTLISKNTNNYIKDKAPSEYIREIERYNDPVAILEPHFISQECIEYMKKNDYENFLKCREEIIKNRILDILRT
jgi:hypothetical protein